MQYVMTKVQQEIDSYLTKVFGRKVEWIIYGTNGFPVVYSMKKFDSFKFSAIFSLICFWTGKGVRYLGEDSDWEAMVLRFKHEGKRYTILNYKLEEEMFLSIFLEKFSEAEKGLGGHIPCEVYRIIKLSL